MTRILACIDGSTYSGSVADHTAWAVTRIAASVDLLHVLGRPGDSSAPIDLSGNLDLGARDALVAELVDLDIQKAKLAQKLGRDILADALQRLGDNGVSKVSELLRRGDVLDTLKDFEEDADLVVIGKRGGAADFAKLHLGSNLERVLRGSSKPVLVASRSYVPIRRFLIAFDGGSSAVKAVNYIAESPLFAGIACHIFTVSAGGEAEAGMREAEMRLRNAGFDVTVAVEEGGPGEVIARKVDDGAIDLLVMGAYGHSPIRTFIIGSTTTALIRSCKVAALLFR